MLVKLFCVSRYIAHTCRGRLKLARMRKGKLCHNDEGSPDCKSHRGLLNFHVYQGRYIAHTCRGRLKLARMIKGKPCLNDEGSPDCKSHRGLLNFHFLGGSLFRLFKPGKKFCRESNPGRQTAVFQRGNEYILIRHCNDYDCDVR